MDDLKTNIQKFMVECLVFQQNKVETIKTPCLLQPLVIPSQSWEEVSMDFITGLLRFEGKCVIMVVVDKFTKYLSKPIQLLLQLRKQFKSYMETQRLL